MAEFISPDSIPDAVYIYTSQKTETKPLYIFLGLTLTLTLTLWLLHTEQNGLNNVQC